MVEEQKKREAPSPQTKINVKKLKKNLNRALRVKDRFKSYAEFYKGQGDYLQSVIDLEREEAKWDVLEAQEKIEKLKKEKQTAGEYCDYVEGVMANLEKENEELRKTIKDLNHKIRLLNGDPVTKGGSKPSGFGQR